MCNGFYCTLYRIRCPVSQSDWLTGHVCPNKRRKTTALVYFTCTYTVCVCMCKVFDLVCGLVASLKFIILGFCVWFFVGLLFHQNKNKKRITLDHFLLHTHKHKSLCPTTTSSHPPIFELNCEFSNFSPSVKTFTNLL